MLLIHKVWSLLLPSPKLRILDGNSTENKNKSGYRLLDITIFKSLISSLACPDCLTTSLEMVEQLPKKKGFASYFPTVCSKCNYSRNLYSSKTFSPNLFKKKVGMKYFEANLRMVYATRSNGIGFSGLEKFCSVMNLPKPMARCNYDKLSNLPRDAVKCGRNEHEECCSNNPSEYQCER